MDARSILRGRTPLFAPALALAVAVGFAGVGCDEERSEGVHPESGRGRTAGRAAPEASLGWLPPAGGGEEGYRIAGKRDPFRPPADLGSEPPVTPTVREILCERTPLTQLDRLDLKVEGIVTQEAQGGAPRAVVSGAQGRGFVIGEGDLVTTDCAVVEKILEDRIVLAVPRADQKGGTVILEDVVRLRLDDTAQARPTCIDAPGGGAIREAQPPGKRVG